MRTARAGVALLEALVALAVLATTGLAIAQLLTAGLRSEQDARERERALAAEERVLAALTLLSRDDLDRYLGRHRLGEFSTNVERPEPTLYRIAIADSVAPEVEALVTVVYRRESAHAQ